MLVGVFTLPVSKKSGEYNLESPEACKVLRDEGIGVSDGDVDELLPREDGEGIAEEGAQPIRPEDQDALDSWESENVEENTEVEIRNSILEILPNRGGGHMIAALAKMVARLTYLGLPVRRIHSDRAGELGSKGMKKWAESRGIVRTYTAGSDWRSNGRAEGEIGILKRSINVVLKATEVPVSLWPLAARHVAERRGRQQLAALGFRTPHLLPFNSEVLVETKKHEDFQGHWRMRKKRAWVRCPDPTMSLTSGGHYLVDEAGKYFRGVKPRPAPLTPEMVAAEPALLQDCEVGGGPFADLDPPRRRVHGKSPHGLRALDGGAISRGDHGGYFSRPAYNTWCVSTKS